MKLSTSSQGEIKNKYSVWTGRLNIVSIITFTIGVISLATFSIINITPTGDNMSDEKKEIKKGFVTPESPRKPEEDTSKGFVPPRVPKKPEDGETGYVPPESPIKPPVEPPDGKELD